MLKPVFAPMRVQAYSAGRSSDCRRATEQFVEAVSALTRTTDVTVTESTGKNSRVNGTAC
jgi:hypothetical protein